MWMTSKSLSDAVRREQLANPALPWLILGVAFVGIVSINPIGFIGGGWDDWQYLDAARCWRAHGPCLPHNHWQGRWPVIAPIALSTGLLGESRLSVGLPPLIASLWCLVLVVFVGNRLFRAPVGFIAAGLLLCTAAFAIQILDPSVEAIELGFGLTGIMALLQWQRKAGWAWPALSGISFGLAVQVRETAVILAGLAALYVVSRHIPFRRREKILMAVSFALPFVVEFGTYAKLTGDPLYRRHLSLLHTQIPSSELLAPIDHSHSALFNFNNIANWRRDPGLHLNWAIDGLLNLFINAKAGLSLLLIPVLIVAYRRSVSSRVVTAALLLYGASFLYICVLIYVIALDPKPRLMFFPLTALSLALALLLVRLHDAGRHLIVWVSAGVSVAVCLAILFVHQRVYPLEGPAAAWIASAPGQVEIEENTRRHLALVPSAQLLPTMSGKRPILLVKADAKCRVWAASSGLDAELLLLREQPMSRAILFDKRLTSELCLFRLLHPLDKHELLTGVGKADWYGLEASRFRKLG